MTAPKASIDYAQISNVTIGGICGWQYPDFVDAFVESGEYMGRELTESERDELTLDYDFVYDHIIQQVY